MSWARSHDTSTVPDGQKITLSAANGWTYSSPDIFEGSTVALSEVDAWPETVTQSATLTGPDGEPIEANGNGSYIFTVTHADSALGYVLTNTGNVPTQALQAQKDLTNPDGVSLPESTTFTVTAPRPGPTTRRRV